MPDSILHDGQERLRQHAAEGLRHVAFDEEAQGFSK